jgi:hypothetical protein
MAVRNINLNANVVDTNPKARALEMVDWSVINNEFQTQMKDIETDRENQRNEIEKSSKEMFDTLNNSPLGNHTGRNETLLEYADNAKEAMLMLDRNLKNRNISLKDYTIARQNLKDGTDQLFSAMEEWNTDYSTAMARMQDCGKPGPDGKMIDCSSAQEQFQMMQAEGLGKFEDHALYINPSNFRVSLGKRERDPETGQLTGGISKDQNDFAEVQALRSRSKQKINKFDLEGNLDKIEAHLSTAWKEVQKTNPDIKTVTDARENPAFKAATENWINSMMTNPTDVGSMLTDFLKFNPNTQEQYRFTMDAEDAANDPNAILLISDPTRPSSGTLIPDFSTDNGKLQEKAAYDLLQTGLDGQLDRLEEYQAPVKQTKAELDASNKGKAAENFVVNLSELWSGDNREVNQILSTLSGQNDDIAKMWVGDDDMVHIRKTGEDGELIEVTPIPRGNDAKDFIRAIITHVSGDHEILDLEGAIDRAGVFEGMKKGTGVGVTERTITEKVEDFNTAERENEEGGVDRPSEYLLDYDDLAYDSSKNAQTFNNNAQDILSFLPSSFTKGGTVTQNTTTVTYTNEDGNKVTLLGGNKDDGSITVYYPELMTGPITIPANTDSQKDKKNVTLFNKVMEDIFNAAQQGGEKVKPNQWKSIFQDDDWSKFNNAELFMELGLIDSVEQWSKGDGVYTPGRPQTSTTGQTSKNDWSKFNK